MLAYQALEPQNHCRKQKYLRTLDSLLLRRACCPGIDSNSDRTRAGSLAPHSPPGLATDVGSGAVKPAPTLGLTGSSDDGDGRPVRLAALVVTLAERVIV